MAVGACRGRRRWRGSCNAENFRHTGGMIKSLISRVLVLVMLLPLLGMSAGCDNRAKEVTAADDA